MDDLAESIYLKCFPDTDEPLSEQDTIRHSNEIAEVIVKYLTDNNLTLTSTNSAEGLNEI